MDDSIVDIDEALSDSFSAPTDESFDDVNAIVQKWKQTGEESSPIGDDKFLNTRTFTRPKRRVYAKCSPSLFATPQPVGITTPSAATPSASINLKIGGLVTGGGSSNSMQRSFLGDVSPPSSMCSTSFTSSTLDQQMVGSLITSNDFTGINYFAESTVPAVAAADRFNELFETSRPQVFDDISMLNTPYETDAADELAQADDTFVQLTVRVGAIQENLVKTNNHPIGGDLNDKMLLEDGSIVASDDIQLDATYDNDTLTNRTLVVMDAQQPLNVTVDAVPSVTAAQQPFEDGQHISNQTCVKEAPSVVDEGNEIAWGRTLNDTFQLDAIQLEADNTFDMGASLQPAMDDSIPCAGHLVQPERDYGLQSTPLKARTTHTNMLNEFTSIVNISPITNQSNQLTTTAVTNAPNSNFQTYVRPKSRPTPQETAFVQHTDDDIDDLPSPIIRTGSSQRSERPTNVQRDLDERQSLTNFEEFEKSMSLCQNDHDFDDMLNGLAGRSQHNRNATDVQMRQSLDHIKKRHSLLNLEKQLEDQQRRINTTVPTSLPSNASADSNRLLNSTHSNRSMTTSSMLLSTTSSSGSGGERLLRRSRVMDEYSSPSRGPPLTMDKSTGSGTNSSCTSSTLSDSKENVQNNFDSNRGTRDTEQTSLTATSTGDMGGGVLEQLKPRSIPNNRDRFKTIRISKRPPEHDAIPHIPDDACTYSEVPDDGDSNGPDPTSSESSPSPQQQVTMNDTNREASPQATLPRRRLTRPSQLSGLTMRRESSLTIGRANGGTHAQQQQPSNADARSQVNTITSPMGIKAKSIQNLVEREKSSDETNARSQKEQSDPVFKVPSGLPTTHRMRSIARPSGLIRPSSGLYSYGVRRNDSDTESGRMSPTNSLSSGSSKGSLYRADADSSRSTDDVVKTEVLVAVEPMMAPTAPVKVQPPPRRSGLQPPSASGAYAAANRKRSGLPRPMSLANR